MEKFNAWCKKHLGLFIQPAFLIMLVLFTISVSMLLLNKAQNENIELKKSFVLRQDSLIIAVTKQISKLQAGISQNDSRRWKILGIQKWIEGVNRNLDEELAHRYATIIVNESEIQKNVSPELIASIIRQESYFINNAKSTAGAIGLMGIMEPTARWICKELNIPFHINNLKDPEISVKLGTYFLSYLMGEYEGNEKLVLAHYNGGYLQKNNYINKNKYKHTDEFKWKIGDIKNKVKYLEDSLMQAGITDFDKHYQYNYFSNVLSAKSLSSETEKYIPEVIARRKKIENFLANPDIFSKDQS